MRSSRVCNVGEVTEAPSTVSAPPAPDADFYYASLYCPPAERSRIRALRALHQEITAIPLAVSDRGVARVKLEWWRSEALRLAEGQSNHQLSRACLESGSTGGKLSAAVLALVAGLDRELAGHRLRDADEQLTWYDDSFGTYYALYAPMADAESPAAGDLARELGCRIEIADSLLRLKPLSRKQLYRFPDAALAATGCSWDDLATSANTNGLARFADREAERIILSLEDCVNAAPRTARRENRALVTLAWLTRATLQEMRADGCRVWLHRVELTPIRKLWCAFRTRWS